MIHLPRMGLGPLCFEPKAVNMVLYVHRTVRLIRDGPKAVQGFLLKAWPAVVTSLSLPFSIL